MMANFEFTPGTIYQLFGAADAENEAPERLKEYFYRNRAYESVQADIPIRILVGHKGVGKSALLKMAHLEDCEADRPSIWLQPSDLTTLDGTYDPRFDKAALAWQQGLLKVLLGKIAELFVGGGSADESSILLATSKDLFQAAKKLCEKHLGLKSDETTKAIAEKFLKESRIFVYIDDLDRGWSGKKSDILRVSALLNALRDICGDFKGVQFRIGLRTDVYHLVRTSDESTDKITQYLIPLTWANHDILVCMAKRVGTYFGEDMSDAKMAALSQNEVARHLHKIISPVFSGAGKWERAPIHRVLLSLTRRRPRDLVKLLTGAAQRSYGKREDVISTESLRSTFVDYSQDRLQDIINEFRSELPNIQTLLLGMRPNKSKKEEPHPFLYNGAQLAEKVRNILSSSSLRFANNEHVDVHSIKGFLYKIDFLIARTTREDGWADWTYFDEDRFAAVREADFGYSWEVHPAYRWALEKKDVQQIIDETDLIVPA